MNALIRIPTLTTGLLLIALMVLVACGEETTPTGTPPPTTTPTATVTPTATATATLTPTPEAMVEPTGVLNFGVGEVGPEVYVPKNQGYIETIFDARVTHEYLFAYGQDGSIGPQLVKEWVDETGPDGWSRTFKLQEGVSWHTTHGNWGQWNADDFIFTIENLAAEGSRHTDSGRNRPLFFCDDCTLAKVDDLTVQLKRPSPTFEIAWWHAAPVGNSTMRSKKHFDAVGEEVANTQSVGTGPWQLVDSRSDDFKKTEAVRDHWRKTPEFAEFIWHQIGEESTRLANFLTGELDTAQLSADSIRAVQGENRAGDVFRVFPGTRLQYIHVHGQIYYPDHPAHTGASPDVPLGEGASYEESCKVQPWVSCDRNVNSAEWDRARKIRLAMAISIDRQKMINNLAFGEGVPAYTFGFMGHPASTAKYGLDQLTWEYDPTRAKQLLAEGGHPEGFEVEMHLTGTGGIGVDTTGEIIASMWREVGIEAKETVQPYGSFRPLIVARTARGVRPDEQGVANDPLRYYSSFYNPENGFNFGIEHPDLQALVDEAKGIFDTEARFAKSAEIAKWMHDHIANIPLYEENTTWVLGPELGEWDIQPFQIEWLNNWEFAPHRK